MPDPISLMHIPELYLHVITEPPYSLAGRVASHVVLTQGGDWQLGLEETLVQL